MTTFWTAAGDDVTVLWSADGYPGWTADGYGGTPPPPPIALVRVMATQAGYYNSDYKDIGDVFDVPIIGALSDAAVEIPPIGNADYPYYGWMQQVPSTTPLTSWALSGSSSPRQAPRRTVL